MTERSSVEALSPDLLDDVAALIAREHQHVSARGVPLPSRFLDAAACRSELQALLLEGYSGFVARRGSHVVALMCGRTSEGVGFVPAHGVAVEPGVSDPSRVMAELFAELAPVLVVGGAVRFTVDHVDDERVAIALFDLGFGRGGVFAVRSTDAIEVESTVEIRVGTAADLDSIAALGHAEFRYRAAPPMYATEHQRSLADTRAVHERLLEGGAIHLIGRRRGRDVGLLTIEPTSPAPRLCAADVPYIGATATDPDSRGTGVGRALVAAALERGRVDGHETMSVDFDARNLLSRPFWTDNGFRRTGYRLRRVLGH